MAIGILCLAFLSVRIARNDFSATGGYEVGAIFTNGNGIRNGTAVMIAGVEVGRVKQVALQDYEAKVTLMIQPDIVLQKDVIASIKTKGLIGEKYIEIAPGASDQKIAPNGVIHDTESALDMEGLISKFIQGSVTKPAN